MQSYPERPNPLSTTLFISYLVAFCLVVFDIFVVSIKIHTQL